MMADNDKDLVLYLPLDAIQSHSTVRDASGLANDGRATGNITQVPDAVFGSCLSFNETGKGDHIVVGNLALAEASPAHTIEAWVYVKAYPPGRSWLLFLGQEGPGAHHWLLQPNGAGQLGRWVGPQFAPTIPKETWTHIALVYDGRQLHCYVNGIAQGDPKPAQFNITNWNLTIAKGAQGELDFSGKIANLHIYKRALSQAEIARDMRLDCMHLAPFRKSHPIDFRLYDDDEQAVLYISDDPDGHNLHLELHNTSTQAIQLANGQGAAASETNHHFALRFRPATLSDSAIKFLIEAKERAKILKEADANTWDLYFPANPPAANEPALLYLLYKGPSKSFQPDERRTLTLQRMSAAPGSGSRGTQVELLPRQLTAAGGDATPITGTRSQYVHITNQRGRKYIPLHVGFICGNTVLNDGQTLNKLRLRITNVMKEGELALNPEASNTPSFIISFDTQLQAEDKDWALVERAIADQSPPVEVTSTRGTVKLVGDPGVGGPGKALEWGVFFAAKDRLAAGKNLQIDIGNIRTKLPTGHANLYVRYNIPGYWEGQFVCTVEKAPIVFRDVTHDHEKPNGQKEQVFHQGWVGVGNGAPQNLLHVGDGTSAIREDQVNVVVTSKTPHAGIAIGQGEGVNVLLQASQAGGHIGTNSEHTLTFRTNNKDRVSIDKEGNVLMCGTLTAKQFTGEGVLVTGMIVMWSGKSADIPAGWALCDGKDGKTPDLRDRFILGSADSFASATDEKRTGGASSHTHTMREAGEHRHEVARGGGSMALNPNDGNTLMQIAGNHAHAIDATSTLPPYYKMAFIMKL
jgi:hypothetical protein